MTTNEPSANVTQRVFDSMAKANRVDANGQGGEYLTPLQWSQRTPGVGCESCRAVLKVFSRSGLAARKREGRTFRYALRHDAQRPIDKRTMNGKRIDAE